MNARALPARPFAVVLAFALGHLLFTTSLVAADLTVPSWIQVDHRDRVVRLTLVAGETDVNNHWNFNGYHDGNATVVVPQNYRVELELVNRDPEHPHSVAVLEQIGDYPRAFTRVEPAFAGAITENATSERRATASGESDSIEFEVRKAGDYALVCLVPGHAVEGMWIHFRVSPGRELGLQDER